MNLLEFITNDLQVRLHSTGVEHANVAATDTYTSALDTVSLAAKSLAREQALCQEIAKLKEENGLLRQKASAKKWAELELENRNLNRTLSKYKEAKDAALAYLHSLDEL